MVGVLNNQRQRNGEESKSTLLQRTVSAPTGTGASLGSTHVRNQSQQARHHKDGNVRHKKEGVGAQINLTSRNHTSVTASRRKCKDCFHPAYTFIIDEPDLCTRPNDQSIDLVLLILTSLQNRARRNVIRETWASVTQNNTSSYYRHVFLLGASRNDKLMRQIRTESVQFRDILLGDFMDTYLNLTLKTLMGLKWATTRCSHARYFLKVDDDVWVNMARMNKTLGSMKGVLKHKLGGMCRNNTNVIRDPKSKWYVSKESFPDKVYPPYCVGLAYIGGMPVAERVIAVSKDVPFFYIEDVYVGLCLQAAGIGVKKIDGFQHSKVKINNTCVAHKLITLHSVPPPLMKDIWTAKCDQ